MKEAAVSLLTWPRPRLKMRTATRMSAFWQFAVRSRICRDRQTWRIEDETSIAKRKLMALFIRIKKRFSARGVL